MTTTQTAPLEIELAEYVHRAMRHAGVGISELATAVGASRNTVSRWVNGTTKPNARDRRAIELATGIPVGWLDAVMVRPEGFEPPAYWSVVSRDDLGLAA